MDQTTEKVAFDGSIESAISAIIEPESVENEENSTNEVAESEDENETDDVEAEAEDDSEESDSAMTTRKNQKTRLGTTKTLTKPTRQNLSTPSRLMALNSRSHLAS